MMLRCFSRLLVVAFAVSPLAATADVVTDWNEVALDAIRTDKTSPPRASRALAMVHIAIYEAVNAVDGTHEPYFATSTSPTGSSCTSLSIACRNTYESSLVAKSAPDGTSVEAAAATAAHGVLVGLYPAQEETFDAALAASLGAIDDGAPKDDGIELGESKADQVLAARAEDHSTDVVEFTPGTDPEDWQPTPPAFAAALLPNWPTVTPFALTSGSQFRGDGPPTLDSAEFAVVYNETKEIGRVDSATRTEEQTEIALFWANGGGTATPPGHWNSIAQIIAEEQGNTLVENARLFALLNIAQADAAIVSWDNKYAYNHCRPVTAIRAGDLDDNDATEADAEWTPFLVTPPFPEYTSGHSTFSGAASKVLELFYESDEISFITNSDGLPETFRSYTSFSQAADESGRSRIFSGIHWQYANADGLSSGREIGKYAFDNFLQPVNGDGDGGGGPRICGIFGLGNIFSLAAMLSIMGLLRKRHS